MRKLLYAGMIMIGLLASGCGSAEEPNAAKPAAADEHLTEPSETPYESGSATPEPGTPASPTSSVMATPTGPAKVDVAQTSLGTILVGTEGRTLYLFTEDKKDKSTCSAACAAAWPPALTLGTPQAGTGVNASMLGTLKREDGATQITYNKHPLYYYAKDQKAGDTAGQDVKDFSGEWYAVTPEGKKAKH
ncbi:COG4315 family predicted lipoprotein [Sphaerimonospora sp. CA-214678]|uniref:COG4315 family predicted lipoprotein n=1 Tax=Sphaerimonospora sp. CA-214678 TaxID=3240029 RepID=UPI003D8D7870